MRKEINEVTVGVGGDGLFFVRADDPRPSDEMGPRKGLEEYGGWEGGGGGGRNFGETKIPLQALAKLKPTPEPTPPSKDEQLEALRVAVRALLANGKQLRPDLVAAAQHALDISGTKPLPLRCCISVAGVVHDELDIPEFLRRPAGRAEDMRPYLGEKL